MLACLLARSLALCHWMGGERRRGGCWSLFKTRAPGLDLIWSDPVRVVGLRWAGQRTEHLLRIGLAFVITPPHSGRQRQKRRAELRCVGNGAATRRTKLNPCFPSRNRSWNRVSGSGHPPYWDSENPVCVFHSCHHCGLPRSMIFGFPLTTKTRMGETRVIRKFRESKPNAVDIVARKKGVLGLRMVRCGSCRSAARWCCRLRSTAA